MDACLLRSGFRRVTSFRHASAHKRGCLQFESRRCLATPTTSQDDIRAAPPIRFQSDDGQFARQRPRRQNNNAQLEGDESENHDETRQLLRRIRVVPASPSYFTATPQYTDDLLSLSALLRKYQTLPLLPPGHAPRVAWRTYAQYKSVVREPVKAARYNRILELLRRLNYIHSSVLPVEVKVALERYKRDVQPHHNVAKPILIDEHGRARAVGRRKSSNAVVYLVEGEGECLVNGKSLSEYFSRLHDRESAIWALKATERLDKYNVWAVTHGGGTTGQADAITLGVAKALLAHEPALKPALRRAGVVTRDPRRVERKKPGKLKARKMPAWVKR